MALTHASMRGGKVQHSDNERLEFIGDRVLGLAIAEVLSERFPSASEGELARRYNRLVRGEACARVARARRHRCSISSCRKAKRAAAGAPRAPFSPTRWRRFWAPSSSTPASRRRALGRAAPVGAAEDDQHTTSAGPDAKSALQEWAQGKGLALPEYVEVSRKGPDHAPRFTSEVRIDGCAAGARRGGFEAGRRAGGRAGAAGA